MEQLVSEKSEKKLYTILMIVVASFWGYGFIATSKAIEAGYTAAFMQIIRFGLCSVIFGWLLRKKLFSITRIEAVGGVLSGVSLFAGFTLQNMGLARTTPSNSALITVSNIMFVPFFVWLIFKKKPTKRIILGSVCCLLGISILSVDWKNMAVLGFGDFLTLLCAIAFALHIVILGYFALRGREEILNFLQMLSAAVCSIVLFLIMGDDPAQFVPRIDLLWIVYLVVFSTMIAFLVQAKALKVLTPSSVMIISASESIFASVFSLLYGYETLTLKLIIGATMVFLAIFIVEGRGKKAQA